MHNLMRDHLYLPAEVAQRLQPMGLVVLGNSEGAKQGLARMVAEYV